MYRIIGLRVFKLQNNTYKYTYEFLPKQGYYVTSGLGEI